MSYLTDSFDDKIIQLLMAGGVGVLPTDTIYGLSCSALNQSALKKVHSLKKRSADKPYVILISNTSQLKRLGITDANVEVALADWPGVTVICAAPGAPDWLHMGAHSLAIRQPTLETLSGLIDKVGPIISTSVNLAGKKNAQTINQAQRYFGDKLDFYVEAGELTGRPSTIVRVIGQKLEVVRQGAVKINQKESL